MPWCRDEWASWQPHNKSFCQKLPKTQIKKAKNWPMMTQGNAEIVDPGGWRSVHQSRGFNQWQSSELIFLKKVIERVRAYIMRCWCGKAVSRRGLINSPSACCLRIGVIPGNTYFKGLGLRRWRCQGRESALFGDLKPIDEWHDPVGSRTHELHLRLSFLSL